MDAARFDAYENVARTYFLAVDDLLLIDDADGKPREVVLSPGIKAGHFRRFAADQRAPRLPATFRNAFHDFRFRFRIEQTAGVIIEKEKGFGALADDVVDAHRHRVDTDGVVFFEKESVFELGAYAVRARHEHGLLHLLARNRVEAAERTDVAEHVFIIGGLDVFFHEIHRFIAARYIYAAVFIRNCHCFSLLFYRSLSPAISCGPFCPFVIRI